MQIHPLIHKLLRRALDNTSAIPSVRWKHGIPKTAFLWVYENTFTVTGMPNELNKDWLHCYLQRSQLHTESTPNISRTLSIAQGSRRGRLMFFILTAVRPVTSLSAVNTAWRLLLSCSQSLRHTRPLRSSHQLDIRHYRMLQWSLDMHFSTCMTSVYTPMLILASYQGQYSFAHHLAQKLSSDDITHGERRSYRKFVLTDVQHHLYGCICDYYHTVRKIIVR